MKQLFSALSGQRERRKAALALSLLTGLASPAFAQTSPAVIYGLGLASQTAGAFTAGQQLIIPLFPANLANSNALFGTAVAITGVAAGQQVVGLDYRPATGELYALGVDRSIDASNGTTPNAQLYVITPTTSGGTPSVATARGGAISLNLQDANRANTRGLHLNVGFDFNPTVDRIRIVAPNGTNYRINPNNGARVIDGNLNYVMGNTVGHAPYVGTAAYTNSALGLTGTTLYDLDVTATNYGTAPATNNSRLSTQAPPNNGVLNPIAPLTFAVNGATNYTPLASPTVGLSLDIAYAAASNGNPAGNLAYVLEARYSDPDNLSADNNRGDGVNRIASNLYAFDLATGRATGRNIFGSIPTYLFDLATPIAPPITWIGVTSTDWNTGSNWSTGTVPTATDIVVIPGNGTVVATSSGNQTVAFQPTVTNTQDIRTVNLAVGGTLTVNGQLNVFGNFVNNDGVVAGSGLVNLADNTATTTSATHIIGGNAVSAFPNLDVNAPGATTSGPAAIVQRLRVNSNLAIGTDQVFTLRSSASGTAYVVNNGGTVSGAATVQRYITPTNAGAGYRHYSTPVSGNTMADFTTTGYTPTVNPNYNTSATPFAVTPFPTIYTYDQARLSLNSATPEFDRGFASPSALTDPLAVATGYTVNIGASQLVDFVGTLNQAASYSRSNLARGTQATAGYQFLGNPYPGAVNYDVVLTNSTGIESALFVYKSNGQYTGTYTSYVNGLGTSTGTNNLPVAQGFFVRTAAGQTGTVNFTNAARTNLPETALFQRTAADARPTLAFTLRNASIANQARVYFEQGATAAFDAKFDAHYLPATHGLDLASDLSTEALAINGLPELTGATTVALRVHAPTAGTYTLAVDELANLPAGYRAYLRDASTGTYTDLSTTPSVNLTLDPSDAPTGRFALLFTAASPLATAPAALAALAAVYPSPAHGMATLILPQALRGTSASTVQLLNSLGQVVLTKTVAAGSGTTIELPLTGIAAGIYTVRATTEAGLVAKRLVVQ